MISVIVYIKEGDYAYLETLKSVQSQLFKDKEIIAVCDACSLEDLQKIKLNADKVVAFKNSRGASVCKNEGAERAIGEVVMFIDAGVILSAEVLSDVWNTKSEWVIGTCRVESPDDEAEYRSVFEFKNKYLVKRGDHNGVVFSKRLTFNVLGMFDTNLSKNLLGKDSAKGVDENRDLIKRFKKKGKFKVVESPIYPSAKEFVGKSKFKAKMYAWKKFRGKL